jgi:hypothetical protein
VLKLKAAPSFCQMYYHEGEGMPVTGIFFESSAIIEIRRTECRCLCRTTGHIIGYRASRFLRRLGGWFVFAGLRRHGGM